MMKIGIAAACAGMTLCAAAADGLLPKKSGQPDFLPVDQAFELQPLEWQNGALRVSWHVAKGYYLYRDRLKFTAKAPDALKLGAPTLPPSEGHDDEHFGTQQVYRNDFAVQLPVAGKLAKGPVSVTVVYQGCADAGLCYPPQTRTLEAAR